MNNTFSKRTVVQNSEIAWQVYDGEAVLVDPNESVCRVLNETAALIWQACNKPSTVEELAEHLREEYGADIENIQADTEEIVQEFLDKDLLQECEQEDAADSE